jgi:hypothetical protein
VTETVRLPVLAGGVVGVRQASHEDHAGFLAERLNGHSNTGGRTAGNHHGAVFFDHRTCRCARRVGLGLGVARDEFDLLAHDAVALQGLRREGVEHAAVAAAIEMLNGQFECAQLVGAFISVRAGLRYVEAERDRRACWLIGERAGSAGENCRHGQAGANICAGLNQTPA